MVSPVSRQAWRWGCSTWVLAVLLAWASPAAAQFDRGQISGVVKDTSGAVVPGATVTVTSQRTQVSLTAVTDGSGYYVFPGLLPGQYDVKVELQGFKTSEHIGVPLDAAGKVTIDAVLEAGELTETITVAAESTPLQYDTAVRKTIETKDIQDLALNGRNPINLALLKPGVRGGTFNTFNPDSLTSGGYSINGSRSDENLITVDGVIATRTRSSGAIIGTQNVDAIDEVQVLTTNYAPEFGRSSGGQIRFVTKSGGSEFHGSLFAFVRDESLDANSWSRNSSPDPDLNSGPAPFSYNQLGFNVGGPVFIPGKFNESKDKLFFFVAEEWIRWRQFDTNTGTVPTAAMRTGDFSELLDPNNPFYGESVVITDPLTGQPFPNNVIPSHRLSPSGTGLLRSYPTPTAGFQRGEDNWIAESENPRDTRKDTVRLDYRLNANNNMSFRYSYFDWKAVDAFRGTFPIARTDWDRPNTTMAASWTSTLTNTLVNEFTFGYSLDEVYINVLDNGLYQRSQYGIDYPYIFPEKLISDKIPTIDVAGLSTVDGGPYPSSSTGPIWTWSNNLTWIKGRHTIKGGAFLEYSGEDDFDQINVVGLPGDTNNQNGRFEFRDTRPGGTGNAIANAAMGLFTNYAEIGQRSLTKWRAFATDFFIQDSWKMTDKLTVEYGTRYSLWPPWHARLNNIAMFDPSFYDPADAASVDPVTGRVTGGDPLNGVVLPGDGWPSDASGVIDAASNPEFDRLFRGLPRGFSDTHYNVFEPRVGVAYSLNEKTVIKGGAGVFHNRVTLNDSTLLGGNPPLQPKVGVSNGQVDDPTGGTGANFPLVLTSQDRDFKHPTAYAWSIGFQRELPWRTVLTVDYVGRRGIHEQRERNINQLPAGTLLANPGVNPNALRPFRGFGIIRLSENAAKSRYNGLQFSLERRYFNGLKVAVAYTYSKIKDNADNKRDILPNTFDDSAYYATSDRERTHVFNFHYIYDLPFFKDSTSPLAWVLGDWQISGVTFFQSGEPLWVTRDDDVAGVGDTNDQPYDLVSGQDPNNANQEFGDAGFWFNPNAFQRPAPGTFGNAPRNLLRGPGFQSWDIAFLKNVTLGGSKRLQFRVEVFNFPNHPNWQEPETNPTSGDFGRVTSKTSQRNIQLGLKFYF